MRNKDEKFVIQININRIGDQGRQKSTNLVLNWC